MMYQVNCEEFGINTTIQIIDALNDAGLYDAVNYPWHTKMIDRECEKLKRKIEKEPKKRIVDIVLGLSRIPISPVTEIINECLLKFTQDDFSMCVGELFVKTDMFETIIMDEISFIPDDDKACRMICHYLLRTTKQISKLALQTEIFQIGQSVFEQQSQNTIDNEKSADTKTNDQNQGT